MFRMFLKEHDKTAIVWKDEEVSYRELLKRIEAFSRAFPRKGCSKVAIFSENRPEWIYAFYGSWKKGCVNVPIDFMSPAEDVAYILEDCRPELVFCSRDTWTVLEKVSRGLSYKVDIVVFEDMKEDGGREEAIEFPEHDLHSTAVIIYTSGTTGSPKGVMLSYDNLLANIESVSEEVKIYDSNDRVMVLLPLHHIFPLLGTMVVTLYVGATVVFSPSMAPEDMIHTLQNYGITIIIGVPRLYSLIRKSIKDKINARLATRSIFAAAQKIDSQAISRRLFKKVHQKFGGKVQYLVSGGAKLDEEVGRDLKTLGFEVLEGFGMTEAAPMITFTRPGEVLIGSAGRPMSCNEVKTVDGEIVARGRNVMQGYYQKAAETQAVIKDGWLYTGDLGHLDDQGFIHVTGRKKEIIVLPSGKNVNPVEIEHKLTAMSDCIGEVAVYYADNGLHAIVHPDFKKVKEQEILKLEDFLREHVVDPFNRSAAPYKRVMKVHISSEELPKTRLGKIKRFLLPALTQAASLKQDAGEEPDFQEYRAIKDYLRAQTEKEIYPYNHFEMDLGLDSLDRVSFQTFLQSTFGIDAGEELLMDYPTVEKLSVYIKEKKKRISVSVVKWAEIFREKTDVTLPRSWFTHNLLKNLSRYTLGLYFRLRGEGLGNLPESPFIMVPNHQSLFDGFIVASFLKNRTNKNTYFYAKDKHIRNWWLKFLASRNNVIVMNIDRDLKLSLQKLAEVLKRGKNIIIFPEGTRTKDGRLGRFKKTFAILSRELNVPVVPVAIKGAFEALPTGSRIPRPLKNIQVKFLRPVYPEDHTYDSLNDLVFSRVAAELS